MRSLSLGKVVIATSLAFATGLWMISVMAMEESAEETYEDVILPICGKKAIANNRPDILLVSTLDGKLSALDPNNDGKLLWSIGTGPGSMLSSTISQMELTNNAKWVRLIPSLAGGLYKFDGEVIEPIPLSAEELLRTSFKFADNTVMTGGKESRVYGIEVNSGRIKYECTMDGCFGPAGETLSSPNEDDLEDIIIVKRETQVVRAVEPRSGSEKWNFSVSTHHLTYQPIDDVCNNTDEDNDIMEDDLEELKAVVPEGIICKVDKKRPDVIKWKQNFNSPIVHAWRLDKGQLVPIDLFSNSHLPPKSEAGQLDPSLYIGSYKQQLYIQESGNAEQEMAKVNWRPYLISADSRTTVINHGEVPITNDLPMLTYDPNSAENTALAVFNQGSNSDYPYDSGLYLYPDEPKLELDLVEEITLNATTENQEENLDDDVEEIANAESPVQAVQIIFVSMWYWWQEIALISLLTAAVMNLLITRPYIQGMREGFRRRLDQLTRRRPNILVVERRVEVPYEVQVEVPVPKTPDTGSSDATINFGRSQSTYSNPEFVSRYLTDYEPVQCLGAGGFGVVVESKNKLDENHYAVKRVRLPVREEAKKRVMREVKCLAKLDHRNIVRYYSTWLEYPPVGWQEEVDKQLKINRKSILSNDELEEASECCSNSSYPSETTNNPLKPFDVQPSSATDLSAYDDQKEETKDNEEDSFRVVFEQPSDESEDDDIGEESSDGGIIFQEDSKSNLQKPAPSRSISIVSMTNSKFWKEISDEVVEEDTEEEVVDALVWDAKNQPKPPSVYLYIVMQLCQKESLRSWLKNNCSGRNKGHCLSMFNEICSGVEYVHSQGLIHRDLKPSNIFFANEGTIKIGDFGLATVGCSNANDLSDVLDSQNITSHGDHDEGHTEEVGTELYMSPEQLAKKPYNNKVDIYSLGLILVELLVPFGTQMERIHDLTKLRKMDFSDSSHEKSLDSSEFDLVKCMLDHDPNVRPEATDIMYMDFLREALEEYENTMDSSALSDYHPLQRRRKHLSSQGSNQSNSY